MKKSDEMIFVLSLYNKISDQNPNLSQGLILNKLNAACEKLISAGEIKRETYQDCVYALFPKEREKQIKEYKQQGADEKMTSLTASPYSAGVNANDINKMVDDILNDKPVTLPSSSSFSIDSDPCGRPCYGRSHC